MNQPTSLYLTSLLEVEWQNPEDFEFPNEFAKHWLEEKGSLSRRLGQHCQRLTVEFAAQSDRHCQDVKTG